MVIIWCDAVGRSSTVHRMPGTADTHHYYQPLINYWPPITHLLLTYYFSFYIHPLLYLPRLIISPAVLYTKPTNKIITTHHSYPSQHGFLNSEQPQPPADLSPASLFRPPQNIVHRPQNPHSQNNKAPRLILLPHLHLLARPSPPPRPSQPPLSLRNPSQQNHQLHLQPRTPASGARRQHSGGKERGRVQRMGSANGG